MTNNECSRHDLPGWSSIVTVTFPIKLKRFICVTSAGVNDTWGGRYLTTLTSLFRSSIALSCNWQAACVISLGRPLSSSSCERKWKLSMDTNANNCTLSAWLALSDVTDCSCVNTSFIWSSTERLTISPVARTLCFTSSILLRNSVSFHFGCSW